MKYIALLALVASAFWPSPAQSCAFRITGGELIRCGMSKIEVMNKIGSPQMRNTESIGVNTGFGRGGRTAESWAYVIESDIGGNHYLTVFFASNKVVDIESKQVRR